MHVLSYLKQTLKRKDKTRDSDWDFGARQSPDGSTRDIYSRQRSSTSLGSQSRRPTVPTSEGPQQHQVRGHAITEYTKSYIKHVPASRNASRPQLVLKRRDRVRLLPVVEVQRTSSFWQLASMQRRVEAPDDLQNTVGVHIPWQ